MAEKEFEHYSSKIKNIYLELEDFSFFHSPSSDKESDQRFIGRKELKKRLKALLQWGELKSGAYLITGYRGMGKSSLVNIVLSELSGFQFPKDYFISVFRTLFVCSFLTGLAHIFIPGQDNWLPGILLACLLLSLLLYLYLASPRRDSLTKWSLREVGNVLLVFLCQVILKTLLFLPISNQPTSKDQTKRIGSDVLRGSLFFIIWYGADSNIPSDDFRSLFTTLFNQVIWLFVTCVVLTIIGKVIALALIVARRPWHKIWQRLKYVFIEPFKAWLTQVFRFTKRITIRINLGHEQLEEKNILRLIVKGLIKGHRAETNPIYKTITFIVRASFVWMLSYALVCLEPMNTYIDNIVRDSQIGLLMPSQRSDVLFNIKDDNLELEINDQNLVRSIGNCDSTQDCCLIKFADYVDHVQGSFQQSKQGIGINQSPRLLNKVIKYCGKLVLLTDGFVSVMYYRFRQPFENGMQFQSKSPEWLYAPSRKLDDCFACLFPKKLNYVFLLSLLLSYFFLRRIFQNRAFGFITHRHILQRLLNIEERMNAAVTRESYRGIGGEHTQVFLNLFKSKRKTYPIADAREIEAEITSLLYEIDQIPRFFWKVEHIFVFDELDKIDINQNERISDLAADLEMYPSNTNGSDAFNRIKARQSSVFRILGNLKHFFTTARAKFLFISGRELYETSLADVSDRNSFMGSIFNSIIYVDSFLSEGIHEPSHNKRPNSSGEKGPSIPWNSPDITSMVEKYVCRALMPERKESHHVHSLATYNEYLTGHSTIKSESSAEVRDAKRRKIVNVVRNFITYLAYRSNGAPKKLTTNFEQFVRPVEIATLQDKRNNLVIGQNHKSLYLVFMEVDQYSFGLINYLTTPYFHGVSQHIVNYGDKLTVSSGYLLDYILKYHSIGFSWASLELTPEILDINKAPILRELISRIMVHVTNTHVQKIVSGLFDFKFKNKINKEIGYLSKVNEREAAAFNFTLDESREIKRHYSKLLRKVGQTEMEENEVTKRNIHSLGLIEGTLGDLHYLDQEFDEAIIHYQEALNALRSERRYDKSNHYSIENLMHLIRIMLKLGLAYEKKKSHAVAYSTYTTLTEIIIESINIEIQNLGFVKKILPTTTRLLNLNCNEKVQKEINRIRARGKDVVVIVKIQMPADLDSMNDQHGLVEVTPYDRIIGVEPKFNYLSAIMDLPLSPEKIRLQQLSSLTEGLRLIYQPFLAKLQIIEKGNLSGIRRIDIDKLRTEIQFVKNIASKQEKALIFSEVDKKIGDVLYFKNGVLTNFHSPPKDSDGSKIYCKREGKSRCATNMYVTNIGTHELNSEDHNEQIPDFRAPCSACSFYMNSLVNMIENESYSWFNHIDVKGFSKYNILRGVMEFLTLPNEKLPTRKKRELFMRAMASNLAHIGDTFLSCSSPNEMIGEKFLAAFLLFVDSDKNQESTKDLAKYIEDSKLLKIEEAILCYFLSGSFSLRAGDHLKYSFQLTKTLYVFDTYLSLKKGPCTKIILERLPIIRNTIVRKALRHIYRAYNSTYRPELQKLEQIFGFIEKEQMSGDSVKELSKAEEKQRHQLYRDLLSNLSVKYDVDEVLGIYDSLSLTLEREFHGDILLSRIQKVHEEFLENVSSNRAKGSYCSEDNGSNDKDVLDMYGLSKILFNLNKNENPVLRKQICYAYTRKIIENECNVSLERSGLSCYSGHSGMYNFYHRLLLKGRYNYALYHKADVPSEEQQFLIIDSMYCFLKEIEVLNIFGVSYMINHLTFANAYEKLGYWCEKYEEVCRDLHKTANVDARLTNFKNKLIDVIGTKNMIYITPKHNYEMALHHYESCIETHFENKAYRNMIDDMYYLDDDYNDDLYHFRAALERYTVNSGEIRKRINNCRRKVNDYTNMYEIESYVTSL